MKCVFIEYYDIESDNSQKEERSRWSKESLFVRYIVKVKTENKSERKPALIETH